MGRLDPFVEPWVGACGLLQTSSLSCAVEIATDPA